MIVPDFRNDSGMWVTQFGPDSCRVWTRSGCTWNNMRRRCKPDGSMQRKSPTYIGCSMSDNFKDFQYFTDWSHKQIGYNIPHYELDKDLLVRGNKVYGEDACVFIPHALNMFLAGHVKRRGKLKPGVYYDKGRNKYQAKINRLDGHRHLGRYLTEEAAFEAYKNAKEEEAYKWYERLVGGEFCVDNRVIEVMKNWKWDAQ